MHKKLTDLGRFSDPSLLILGWIEALKAEDRRRPYRITAAGEVALREQLKTLHQIVSVGQQRLAPG